MKTSRRVQWLMSAAAAALPAMMFVSSASAQYATGGDGHALDANLQVGSGGQNSGGSAGPAFTGNQLVTGNVTGGSYFRGSVPYFDALSFRGAIASQGVDNFIRGSTGVPSAYAPSYSQNTPRAFYGGNIVAPPPAGSVSENFSGTYVGTRLSSSGNTTNIVSGLDVLRSQNLGNTTVLGVQPGSLVNNVGMLGNGATPLVSSTAVLTAQASADAGEPLALSLSATPQQPNFSDRFAANQLSQDQLTNPLGNPNPTPGVPSPSSSANQGNASNQTGSNSGAINPSGPGGTQGNNPTANPNQLNSVPLNNSINPGQGGSDDNNPLGPSSLLNQQPANTPVSRYSQSGPSASLNGQSFNTSVSTNQSSRQWLLVPPAQQSAQYRELQRRLEQFNSSHELSDQQADEQFRQAQLALHAKAPNGAQSGAVAGGANGGGGLAPVPSGGGGGGGVVPGGPPAPSGGNGQGGSNTLMKPSDLAGMPLHVTSLAEGMRNVTLHDLLTSAEDLMRNDKFASATEKYDTAIQLTNNNNPLILLGRANSELGASFYGRAETDIRRAVAGDSSVLMGQYDLTKMMDPNRIDFVRGDLETLAKDSKSVRPALLLAYLEYNTGNGAAAQKYLGQAEDLVGNSDPVIELMRTHWTFQSPQMQGGGNMNK